jgi:hypothetical protein
MPLRANITKWTPKSGTTPHEKRLEKSEKVALACQTDSPDVIDLLHIRPTEFRHNTVARGRASYPQLLKNGSAKSSVALKAEQRRHAMPDHN